MTLIFSQIPKFTKKVLFYGCSVFLTDIENRIDLFNRCIKFLDTRVELDQSGFKFDIFEH